MDIVALIYRPLAKLAAHRVLVGRSRSREAASTGRFTGGDVDDLLRAAWSKYGNEVASLPVQPTLGSTMNVRLACLTMAFFDALRTKGVERKYAIELIADVAWWIYRKWAWIAIAVSRMTPGTKVLGFAVTRQGRAGKQVLLRFPFNHPGYTIETIPCESGTAFDVTHCPVSSYFRPRGAADLCLSSWCDLDYALAEMTHETLTRTTTLVGGQGRCDFCITKAISRN